MAKRGLPGLGLVAYFPKGSDDWNDDMDQNIRLLSALVQPVATSKDQALPASPPDGTRYIVPSTDANYPNQLAIRDLGAWVYIVPQAGWTCYVLDVAKLMIFTGTQWKDVNPPVVVDTKLITVVPYSDSARTLAAGDNATMLVYDGTGVGVLTVPHSSLVTLPIGFNCTVKWRGPGALSIAGNDGVSFSIETDMTTNLRVRGSEVSLIYLGSNVWDLVGSLAPKV